MAEIHNPSIITEYLNTTVPIAPEIVTPEEEATLSFFSLVDVLQESDVFRSQPLKNLMEEFREYAQEGLIKVEVSNKDQKTYKEEVYGKDSTLDIPHVDVSMNDGAPYCSVVTLPKDFVTLTKQDPVKSLIDITMSASFARDSINAWMAADTRRVYAYDHSIEETSGRRARAFIAETYLELISKGISTAHHADHANFYMKQFPEGMRSWGQQSTLQYDLPYRSLPPRMKLLPSPKH